MLKQSADDFRVSEPPCAFTGALYRGKALDPGAPKDVRKYSGEKGSRRRNICEHQDMIISHRRAAQQKLESKRDSRFALRLLVGKSECRFGLSFYPLLEQRP